MTQSQLISPAITAVQKRHEKEEVTRLRAKLTCKRRGPVLLRARGRRGFEGRKVKKSKGQRVGRCEDPAKEGLV
jgi:hypothetical protein